MGSKNLNAVAVLWPRWGIDPEAVKRLEAYLSSGLVQANREGFNTHGTAGPVGDCKAAGDLARRYWRGDRWPEGAAWIGTPRLTEDLEVRLWPYYSHSVGYHRRINGRIKYGIEGEAGLEYGSQGAAVWLTTWTRWPRPTICATGLGWTPSPPGRFGAFTTGISSSTWSSRLTAARATGLVGCADGIQAAFPVVVPSAAHIERGDTEKDGNTEGGNRK